MERMSAETLTTTTGHPLPPQVRFGHSLNNSFEIEPDEIVRFLDYLCSAVAGLRDARIPVVYISSTAKWIGHLCQDAHILKNLFDKSAFQLFFASSHPIGSINPAIVSVALRETTFIEVGSEVKQLGCRIGFTALENGFVHVHRGIWFVFGAHSDWLRYAYYHRRQGATARQASFFLTAEEEERRAALFAHLGVETPDRIVALHARTSTYGRGHLGQIEADNAFRNADIANYAEAIRWLVSQGYVVARLGDPGTPPLQGLGPRVIDLPHHPAYAPFFDVAFASAAFFFIHCCSGPTDLARGFGRAMLGINSIFHECWPLEFGDALLPKLYLTAEGETLSLPEILNLDLAAVRLQAQLDWSGVSVVENAPEEILEATREYLSLGGPASETTEVYRGTVMRQAAAPVTLPI
jgi:putative glycosyltransferase (TIGR04372 family)